MREATVAVALAGLVAACAPPKERMPANDAATKDSLFRASTEAAAPTRLASTEGFATPESALWDAAQQVWFVSNINGMPSAKDGNGFLSRLRADGSIETLKWVEGGQRGAILHAPKGMALVGDTLWVADIDAVRGFHRVTGAPLGVFALGAAAKFLNDVAPAPEGGVYVTDTGISIDERGVQHPGPDRVFWLRTGREHTVVLEGDQLERPNGIAWDEGSKRYVIAAFGGPSVFSWAPGDSLRPLARGPGQQDGVEVLADGRLVVSSWADSTVFAVARDGATTTLIRGIPSPADLGLDRARNVLAVPVFTANRVEFWQLR